MIHTPRRKWCLESIIYVEAGRGLQLPTYTRKLAAPRLPPHIQRTCLALPNPDARRARIPSTYV